MTNPTRFKVQRTYALDNDVAQAFDDFCPSGERSSTLNELLKDWLKERGKVKIDPIKLLAEKEMVALKATQEAQALRNRLEVEKKRVRDKMEFDLIEKEKTDFHSSLNERAKAQARFEVLVQMGLDPLSEKVPIDQQADFISKWKGHHGVVLKRLLEEGSQ